MMYNETKTQCKTFWPRSYTQCVLPSALLGTAYLKFDVEAVYLGYNITNNQKDVSDVYKLMTKLNSIGNFLTRKFYSCSEKSEM